MQYRDPDATHRSAGGGLGRLRRSDAAAVEDLVARLRRLLGDEVRRVAVFGSAARGTMDAESDLDVLIVLRTTPVAYRAVWNDVADAAWQVERARGVVLSVVLKSEAEYERMRQAGLLLVANIEREGIDAWTAPRREATFASV